MLLNNKYVESILNKKLIIEYFPTTILRKATSPIAILHM